MNNRLLAINIIYAIVDVILGALGICAFGWGSWFFGRWWMLLFTIIPLTLFSTHSVIIDADFKEAQEGGEEDSRPRTD